MDFTDPAENVDEDVSFCVVKRRQATEKTCDINPHVKRTRTARPSSRRSSFPWPTLHVNKESTSSDNLYSPTSNYLEFSSHCRSDSMHASYNSMSSSNDSSPSSSSLGTIAGESGSGGSCSDSNRLSPISIFKERLGMNERLGGSYKREQSYQVNIDTDDEDDKVQASSRSFARHSGRQQWDGRGQTDATLYPASTVDHSELPENGNYHHASSSGYGNSRHTSPDTYTRQRNSAGSPHHFRQGHGRNQRTPRNSEYRGLHFSTKKRLPNHHPVEFHCSRSGLDRREVPHPGRFENHLDGHYHRGGRSDFHSRRSGNHYNRDTSPLESQAPSSSHRSFNDLLRNYPDTFDAETDDDKSPDCIGTRLNNDDDDVAIRNLSRFMGGRVQSDRDVIVVSPDPVRQVQQMEEDERLAQILQAQFDAELQESSRPAPRTDDEIEPDINDILLWDSEVTWLEFPESSESSSDEEADSRSSQRNSTRSGPSHYRHHHSRPTATSGRRSTRASSRVRVAPGERQIHISVFPGFGVFMDDDDYESLIQLEEAIGEAIPRGLRQADINRLQTRVVGAVSSALATGGTAREENKSCHICLEDYKKGNVLRVLPCIHDFHKSCVDKWLKKNGTCPVCRENAIQRT